MLAAKVANLKKRIEALEKHAKEMEDQRPPDPEVQRLALEVYWLWMDCSFDGPVPLMDWRANVVPPAEVCWSRFWWIKSASSPRNPAGVSAITTCGARLNSPSTVATCIWRAVSSAGLPRVCSIITGQTFPACIHFAISLSRRNPYGLSFAGLPTAGSLKS